MPKTPLGQLLAQSPKIDDAAFWVSFDGCCSSQHPFDNRLSMKAKQNLISAIKYACATSEKTSTYIDTVVKWLKKLSQSDSFLQNFKEQDTVFFQTINLLVLNTFEKAQTKAVDERQVLLITALYHLLQKSPLILAKCGPDIAKNLIVLLTKRAEPFELINRAIALIFTLADSPDVLPVITKLSGQLQNVLLASKYPRVQLQILELFWRLQIPVNNTNFQDCDSQMFIGEAHKFMMQANASQKDHIFNIPFKKITISNGSSFDGGWIDIGFDDLVLCFGEVITTIKFDDVDGLEHNENVFSIALDAPNQDIGVDAGGTIQVEFEEAIPEDQMSLIFARISRGESANGSQVIDPEPEVPDVPIQTQAQRSSIAIKKQENDEDKEEPEKQKVTVDIPQQIEPQVEAVPRKGPRSSIALFIPDSVRKPKADSVSEDATIDLFNSISSEQDSTFQPDENSITSPESTMYSDNESPPPPEIDIVTYATEEPSQYVPEEEHNEISTQLYVQETETPDYPIPEAPKSSKKKKQTKGTKKQNKVEEVIVPDSPPPEPNAKDILAQKNENQESGFNQYTEKVAISLENGMKSLTKGQIEQIDIFTDSLHRRVDSFKEDLQSTVNERATGSLKQIDSAKARFQENIQSFKRREAGIHQSLNSYEDSTKSISQKLSQLQRSMRQEVQKHRQFLEDELSSLRKLVRQDDACDDDDDIDSDF